MVGMVSSQVKRTIKAEQYFLLFADLADMTSIERRQSWIHMDKVEYDKLEWMKDLPPPSADNAQVWTFASNLKHTAFWFFQDECLTVNCQEGYSHIRDFCFASALWFRMQECC